MILEACSSDGFENTQTSIKHTKNMFDFTKCSKLPCFENCHTDPFPVNFRFEYPRYFPWTCKLTLGQYVLWLKNESISYEENINVFCYQSIRKGWSHNQRETIGYPAITKFRAKRKNRVPTTTPNDLST